MDGLIGPGDRLRGQLAASPIDMRGTYAQSLDATHRPAVPSAASAATDQSLGRMPLDDLRGAGQLKAHGHEGCGEERHGPDIR